MHTARVKLAVALACKHKSAKLFEKKKHREAEAEEAALTVWRCTGDWATPFELSTTSTVACLRTTGRFLLAVLSTHTWQAYHKVCVCVRILNSIYFE